MTDRYFDLIYWCIGILALGISGSVALSIFIACLGSMKSGDDD